MKVIFKETTSFKRGQSYHVDHTSRLSGECSKYFRKPQSQEEDMMYRGDGEQDDFADIDVCIKSFSVTVTIKTY